MLKYIFHYDFNYSMLYVISIVLPYVISVTFSIILCNKFLLHYNDYDVKYEIM